MGSAIRYNYKSMKKRTRTTWMTTASRSSRVVRESLQYSSYICSPPCSGLAISRCIFGSMTKSRSSSGTCPMRTGQSSETSMTSTRQSRPSMVNRAAPYTWTVRGPLPVRTRRAKGSEPELLNQAFGHGEGGGPRIHKGVRDLQTPHLVRREQASLGIAQVVGVFDRCPYGHPPHRVGLHDASALLVSREDASPKLFYRKAKGISRGWNTIYHRTPSLAYSSHPAPKL